MYKPDLEPLRSKNDAQLGMKPLAVGWLSGDQPFPTGAVDEAFLARLLLFCADENSLPGGRKSGRCALSDSCPRRFNALPVGDGHAHLDNEIRVIGNDDIYAAPAMIYHYVTVHNYRPPAVFIRAVKKGAAPGSTEHSALMRTLRMGI